jgi:hypothetical protein
MLLNNKGAQENIMLRPGSMQTAELLMENNHTDTMTIQWAVMQEHWFGELHKAPLKMLDTVLPLAGKGRLTFKAPLKEGPYRIYAKVLDGQGNISTANTPFYVVE